MDELLLSIAFVLEAVVSESNNLVYERMGGAIATVNKVLALHKDCKTYCGSIPGTICGFSVGVWENKALLLRGKAYRAMRRFDEALDDFYRITNFDYVHNSWYKMIELRKKASLEAIQVTPCHDLFKLTLSISLTFLTFLLYFFLIRRCEI